MIRAIEIDEGGRRRLRVSLLVVEDEQGHAIDRRILMSKGWEGQPADLPVLGFDVAHVGAVVEALQRLTREAT